jgi:hypothetical protein
MQARLGGEHPGGARSGGAARVMERSKCPSCGAVFGASLLEHCKRTIGDGFTTCRFACGLCVEKLVASLDTFERLGVTLDKSGVSAEYPIIIPEAPGGLDRGNVSGGPHYGPAKSF